MKSRNQLGTKCLSGVKPATVKLLAVSVVALGLTGCRSLEDPGQITNWTLVDPSQRHPIMVKQSPSKIHLSVHQGADGLTPHQRARLSNFLAQYRATGMGNSKLVVAAPSGSPNEVAAMHAVADIRDLISESGFSDDIVSVEAFHDESDPQPPIRVSYLRYVAKGPECGDWSSNLADNPRNLHYPNFGCAQQANLAAMVANPADLLEPRTSAGRDSTRRDVVFGKYYKGESTISSKKKDERASAGKSK